MSLMTFAASAAFILSLIVKEDLKRLRYSKHEQIADQEEDCKTPATIKSTVTVELNEYNSSESSNNAMRKSQKVHAESSLSGVHNESHEI